MSEAKLIPVKIGSTVSPGDVYYKIDIDYQDKVEIIETKIMSITLKKIDKREVFVINDSSGVLFRTSNCYYLEPLSCFVFSSLDQSVVGYLNKIDLKDATKEKLLNRIKQYEKSALEYVERIKKLGAEHYEMLKDISTVDLEKLIKGTS